MASNKAILAKLSGSFTHESSGVVFKKLQVTTHGRLISEAELPNVFTKGLKLTAKVEDGSLAKNAHAKRVGVFGWEYQQPSFSVNGTVDVGASTISKAAVYSFDNVLLGAQTAFNYNKSAVVDHNVALSYRGNDFTATLQTKKKFNTLSGSFHTTCPTTPSTRRSSTTTSSPARTRSAWVAATTPTSSLRTPARSSRTATCLWL
ncbi:hypothetical protein AM588_10001386 [Phytophthora nicotianae]|uniref:Uncharacterized protein n=1 Tax=Phytophthora nicotianae TaxID=4792 RepID=A0A0W8CRJ2_PHYNI|nr:hypothetical protein AM588_10001386 [Phytophthora nicotianae]